MSPENIPSSSETRPTNPKTTRRNPPQDQPAVKCPRCDAWNTKFCYYNNYCITQPRHFCKNCRRYWTKGGTLRNVPIGGGYRKSKKLKTDSTTSSKQFSLGGGGSGELGPVFTGPNPSVELHLGGLPLPRLYSPAAGMYTQYHASRSVPTPGYGHGTDDGLAPYFGLGLLGLNNYPLHSSSSASSRGDNLSSINQEMYWKLRQQRFAMMYGPSSLQDDWKNKY